MATHAVPVSEGPPAAARAWNRLLKPSLTDIYLVMLVCWSFAAAPDGWQRLLGDSDTGFHIRIGDWILAHGAVPQQHLFSFAMPGGTWYAFEWLAEVCFASLHAVGGLSAVACFAGFAIALALVCVVLAAMARGSSGLPALAVGLLSASAATVHFHARPHVFTLLFLSLSVLMLDRDRRAHTHWLWALVPLTAVWANLHAGFLVFLFYLVLVTIGERSIRYALLGALCGAASLLNPYGWRLHEHLLGAAGSRWYYALVDEFKAPDFRNEAHLSFLVLLFAAIALLIPLIEKRRFTDALVILAFGYSGLMAVRNIPIFAIVAGPIIAAELTALLAARTATLPRTSVARILEDISAKAGAALRAPGIWSLAGLGLIILPAVSKPLDFPSDRFPQAMVSAHAAELAQARVYTSDQWANYLIYRSYPRQRVFLDTQHQAYGQAIVEQALGIMSGRRDWSELLDKYRIDMVLCPPGTALATLIRMSPRWTVIGEDGSALLARR